MPGGWVGQDDDHERILKLEETLYDPENGLVARMAEMRGGAKTWQVVIALIINTVLSVGASWIMNRDNADSQATARAIRQFIERHDEQERHMETNR